MAKNAMKLYDEIGQGYRRHRRPDRRIAGAIMNALGDASSIVNVGAGAGSYEPRDRSVIALDSSMTMICQRGSKTAPVVCGNSSELPFRDGTFDASLAILTVHHWSDQAGGLRELRRVAGSRVVILTWDPSFDGFWLTRYFPEILEIDRQIFPPIDVLRQHLGKVEVMDLPIPHDCTDGFLGAYWRRPEQYLERGVRSAISTFSKLGRIDTGIRRLREDLESGEWQRQFGEVLSRSKLDMGYRLVVADIV